MSSPYFFLRPILAIDRGWVAFDWQSSDPFSVEGGELLRCFSEAGLAQLVGVAPVVLPVNPSVLEHSALLDRFEPGQAFFVLPSEAMTSHHAMEMCRTLRGSGARFVVRVDRPDLLRKIPLDVFSCLSLDASFARQEISSADLAYAGDAGFRRIATRVGSHEMFTWLSSRGFDWFDSHFLTARDPLRGKEADIARIKLLKLLNLVQQDGDTREIEEVFRQEPKLAYNLLRLVNSVAVGARTKISCFSQAIAILGRRQLQRWLQLLIYADNLADGQAPNPLMQLAAARGRQMELLSSAVVPSPGVEELSDKAFMTGLFSLLDVLVNLPMAEILKELPMHDEVVNALKYKGDDGVLGRLLAVIVAGESGNFPAAEAILSDLGISSREHAKAQVEALYWAGRINVEHNP